MKLQTIKDNCERLINFKKVSDLGIDWFNVSVPNAKALLDLYGRILDYVGAPISGLSILYISEEEFEEMEVFALSVDPKCYVKPMMYTLEEGVPVEKNTFPIYLNFNYVGFNWHVQKENQ